MQTRKGPQNPRDITCPIDLDPSRSSVVNFQCEELLHMEWSPANTPGCYTKTAACEEQRDFEKVLARIIEDAKDRRQWVKQKALSKMERVRKEQRRRED